MNIETVRLLELGKAVLNEQFPLWDKQKPTLNWIAYTLTLELTTYDTITISDEHTKELMKIDLKELKTKLENKEEKLCIEKSII